MGPEVKLSNPKDVIGSTKLPMDLVPDTIPVFASLAFLEGACKYGRFNWRIAGVRASIYCAAARRHLADWFNGQECDPKTKVPHLSSALACIGIILDAKICGKLVDDRPPAAPINEVIDGMVELVAHIKDTFKDHNPRQWTIADTELSSHDVAMAQPPEPRVMWKVVEPKPPAKENIVPLVANAEEMADWEDAVWGTKYRETMYEPHP
jgi:hypothetical protein